MTLHALDARPAGADTVHPPITRSYLESAYAIDPFAFDMIARWLDHDEG